VQDVESYDPILNPVLNRELRRTGGRVLITLGDQDIDLSPSFTIFLSTRDPTVSTTFALVGPPAHLSHLSDGVCT
jgi:dynein heavy chain 1